MTEYEKLRKKLQKLGDEHKEYFILAIQKNITIEHFLRTLR